MATKAQIFNLALYKAKRTRVANPTQSVELTDIYDLTRDAVLEDHPWNFAKQRTKLTAEESTTDWKYAYSYVLPNSPYCLRVWRLEDLDTGWEVVYGRRLVTDLGSPLRVEYIARVTNEGRFSAQFASALATRLAFEAGPKLGLAAGEIDKLRGEYVDKLKLARSADGQESGADDDWEVEEYLDARA